MVSKSAFSILLAASLLAPGSLLLASPAFAVQSVQVAAVTQAPSNPTLLWTGGRNALVTWGAAADGVSYEVTIAGGDVSRTKVVDGSSSTTFSNLPLNHRYMAGVVAIDASGVRSEMALTNTVALGAPPASEAQATPTPSTSSKPTASPSRTASPQPSSTLSEEPSASPSATPSTSAPATSSSAAPTSSQPIPSQSSPAPAPSVEAGEDSLFTQIQPVQWALGALIALITFGSLLIARRARRNRS